MRGMAALGATIAATALPAVAHASPRADYTQVFTTNVPGAPTGIDTTILYKHPGDPAAKPIPIRQEIFTFPEGMQFDDTVVPDCTVSDIELRLIGPAACPAETWIGGGQNNTTMTGFPPGAETPILNDAFEAGGGAFRVVGRAAQPPFESLRFIAYGRRVDNVTTVDIPQTPGSPPDGAALRRIRNIFPARTIGDRASMRTPATCPASGVWTFHARMTFADGVVEENTHAMPCVAG